MSPRWGQKPILTASHRRSIAGAALGITSVLHKDVERNAIFRSGGRASQLNRINNRRAFKRNAAIASSNWRRFADRGDASISQVFGCQIGTVHPLKQSDKR
jgi:hypothetical protein